MSPTNELGLPPAPPMPPDARERALRALLDEIDESDLDAPAPNRRLRWAPLLTAAAVVLVALAVAAAVALSGPRTGPPAPATGPTTGPTTAPAPPLPESERPAPTGDPLRDDALLRCATAVVGSGRAPDYPPTSTWTSLPPLPHGTVLESELIVNGSFGCLVTPTTVVVTGTTGTPLGAVQAVRLTDDELVLLNPQDRRFTIGTAQQLHPDERTPVMFYPLDPGVSLGDLRLTVAGDGGYAGPVPEPVRALTVVDRPLPTRAANAPGGAELADCLRRIPPQFDTHPDLWMPVGHPDAMAGAPVPLVVRIADVAAGFCVQDPALGPQFAFGRLPAAGAQPALLTAFSGGGFSVALATAPPGVTRVVIAPVAGTAAPTDCTLMDGLAMCTLAGASHGHTADGLTFVVTAFTAADPQGIEVHS